MDDPQPTPPPGPPRSADLPPGTLEQVVAGLGEGVLVADSSGQVLYANAAALEIWGYDDPAAVPGRTEEFEPLFDVRTMDGEPAPVERWALARALRGERFDGLDLRFHRRDGSERIVRCAGGPVQLAGGATGGWVSFRDISWEEAIAQERARDLTRARVTSARLRSLVDLAAAMASVEDLDRLLALVTGEATRLLGADTASLFLLDERGTTLIGRAAVGMPEDEVVGMRIELSGWLEVAEVLRTGRPAVHVRAEEVNGPERPYIRRYGIRSYAALRLGTRERPLGVLFVNHTGRRHRFSRAELAFVETLTSYLSVTIERARLVGSLREAVTSLQDALLPASFPEVPGFEVGALYRSASEVAQVGGDFYDLFPLGGGRVAAVIGDVCGKGVAAARHTARLRYELRALLEADPDPGRVLETFNQKVFAEFAEDEYATLLVLVLDPATGAMGWSSAGHPPPVATDPAPNVLDFAGSLPVGLFPQTRYDTHRLTLPPGHFLMLYTDGVVEARSPDGDEFGTAGLLAALPPAPGVAVDVAEVILKEVQRHTGGELDDDAAVLVLARR
jgi:PAS domain S-box-containing protein